MNLLMRVRNVLGLSSPARAGLAWPACAIALAVPIGVSVVSAGLVSNPATAAGQPIVRSASKPVALDGEGGGKPGNEDTRNLQHRRSAILHRAVLEGSAIFARIHPGDRAELAVEVGEVFEAAFLRGKAEISLALIDAVDNLERALAAAGVNPDGEDALGGASDTGAESSEESAGAGSDGLAHGVLLVFRGLQETLGQMGMEAVNPKGEKFDPRLHEALSAVAADGAESGTVIEVMQKGYRLGEQLVRPARVVVSA